MLIKGAGEVVERRTADTENRYVLRPQDHSDTWRVRQRIGDRLMGATLRVGNNPALGIPVNVPEDAWT